MLPGMFVWKKLCWPGKTRQAIRPFSCFSPDEGPPPGRSEKPEPYSSIFPDASWCQDNPGTRLPEAPVPAPGKWRRLLPQGPRPSEYHSPASPAARAALFPQAGTLFPVGKLQRTLLPPGRIHVPWSQEKPRKAACAHHASPHGTGCRLLPNPSRKDVWEP